MTNAVPRCRGLIGSTEQSRFLEVHSPSVSQGVPIFTKVEKFIILYEWGAEQSSKDNIWPYKSNNDAVGGLYCYTLRF
jgi:hypothetical protein